jgi:hypothetical protein
MNNTVTKQYRVIGTTTTGFVDPKIDTFVKWEGTDTDELSREYPPSDIMFADPLDQKELEGGFIITRFTFEQQLEDGSWEQIDDPRRRLTPVTAYERAIDAENRRLFPGDYITDDDTDEYDDYDVPDYSYDEQEHYNCVDCHDHGSAVCDPQGICSGCGYYAPQELDEAGLCTPCQQDAIEAAKPHCADCTNLLTTPKEVTDQLCTACRNYWKMADRVYHSRLRWFWRPCYWVGKFIKSS